MKELSGHSANFYLVETNAGKLRAQVELILLVSEPRYQAEVGGFAKSRVISDVRLHAGAEALRKLSKDLEEIAVEAEELEARAVLHADPVVPPVIDGAEAA